MTANVSDLPESVRFVTVDLSHVLPRYTALAERYQQRWGLMCVLADVSRASVLSLSRCDGASPPYCCAHRRPCCGACRSWRTRM